MDPIEPSFDPTVFTKNRERLLKHEVGQQLFDEVVAGPTRRGCSRTSTSRSMGR
jgi:hypothetical protein